MNTRIAPRNHQITREGTKRRIKGKKKKKKKGTEKIFFKWQ